RGGEPGERARADRARLGGRAGGGGDYRRRDRLRRPAPGAAAQRHRDRNRPQAVVKSRRGLGVFPSPLWGGVRGGGGRVGQRRCITASPPSPTLPHKGGGSRPSLPLVDSAAHERARVTAALISPPSLTCC